MKTSILAGTICVAIALAVRLVTDANTVVADQGDALPASTLGHPRR